MSNREYPSQERMKRRIKTMRNLIEGNPGVEARKVVALMALKYGLQERTIREYLHTLENADIVNNDDGLLYITAMPAAKDEGEKPSDQLSPAERVYIDAATGRIPDVEIEKEDEENAKEQPKRKRGRPRKTQ